MEAVRANGTVRLETIGRGKAVLRWLEQMTGKRLLRAAAILREEAYLNSGAILGSTESDQQG
jgi:hypothetical protein